ncbi:MAG: hypothetical protein ACLSXC_10245 [Beduini sp.]
MKKIDLGLPSYEDTLFSTEEQRQEAKLEKVIKIPIDEIDARIKTVSVKCKN